MERLSGALFLVGLIFVPAILMIAVRVWCASRIVRLPAVVILALGAGAAAWYAATEHGWRPVLRGGHVATLSPEALFWAVAGSLFVVLLLLALAKERGATAVGGGPGPGCSVDGAWRVGHTGRDRMYYEEFRGNTWQRLEISGEMLMGPAHHIIYFASPSEWELYPEWARGRRDEIIARIRGAFAPPDYEHHGV